MNNVDRDKIYGRDVDDSTDEELEVEPPDSDVLAHQKRAAEERVKLAEMSIDVDEVYRELDHRDAPALPFKLPDKLGFRFQIKHMLIATAVLAMLLTMWRLGVLVNVVGVLILSAMAAAVAYTELKEQQRCAEAERRWQEKLERRRRYFEESNRARTRKPGSPASIYDDVPFQGRVPSEIEPLTAPPFRFQFSLRQVFIGMTIAAVAFGLIHLLGSASVVAMILGMIALGGLVAHAFGARPPQAVVMAWWLVLVMYVLLGLATEFGNLF